MKARNRRLHAAGQALDNQEPERLINCHNWRPEWPEPEPEPLITEAERKAMKSIYLTWGDENEDE